MKKPSTTFPVLRTFAGFCGFLLGFCVRFARTIPLVSDTQSHEKLSHEAQTREFATSLKVASNSLKVAHQLSGTLGLPLRLRYQYTCVRQASFHVSPNCNDLKMSRSVARGDKGTFCRSTGSGRHFVMALCMFCPKPKGYSLSRKQ